MWVHVLPGTAVGLSVLWMSLLILVHGTFISMFLVLQFLNCLSTINGSSVASFGTVGLSIPILTKLEELPGTWFITGRESWALKCKDVHSQFVCTDLSRF